MRGRVEMRIERRTFRRGLVRLTGSAGAGVALTYVVAWGVLGFAGARVSTFRVTGMEPWCVEVPGDWPRGPEFENLDMGLGWRSRFQNSVDHPGEDETYSVSWVEAGWPLRALTGHYGVATHTEEGFVGNGLPVGLNESAPVVPLRPLWAGFVVNTAVYGGAVFLVWSAPGFVRRRVRGRCVMCGYDLRGSGGGVCPECGS